MINSLYAATYTETYGDPDILLKGVDYSDYSASAAYDSVNESWNVGWFTKDDTVWTAWATQWIEYELELTKGNWNIGLDVKNHGNLGNEQWYSMFEISSSMGVNDLKINASDEEIFNGFLNLDIEEDAIYTMRYTWLNDKWAPELGLDANLMIIDAFADKVINPVPEPASLSMLILGALGLVRIKRKK